MAELVFLIFPAAMAFAAFFDLFTMTIPNRLTLGLAAAFLAAAPLAGLGWSEIALHASAGAAMLALGFAMFSFGWVGGGDAKLFAATALWLGWAPLMTYALVFALAGGALTLAIVTARRLPLPAPLGRIGWAARLHDPAGGVPYGIALAAGGLVVYPHTPWAALIAG